MELLAPLQKIRHLTAVMTATFGLVSVFPVVVARAAVGLPSVPLPGAPNPSTLPTVPEVLASPTSALPTVTDLLASPTVPDLPSVPDLVGSGSGGGGDTRPDPSPTRPARSTPAAATTSPTNESVARTPSTASTASGGTGRTAPGRRRASAGGSGAAVVSRDAVGENAPATRGAIGGGPTPASRQSVSTTDSRDIIERIVEVIPGWAKALMGLLAGLSVAMAAAAHRRLRRRAAENRHQARHDLLTGLPNRTQFHDRITQAALRAQEDGRQIAVMLIDLDGFKEVNDTLGHGNGDRLLQQIAARLPEALREGDTVARLGGDEFAVLLPTVAGEGAALMVAEGLRRALDGPFVLADLAIHPDAGIGIAMYPDHGVDADTLIQHADVAMYLAKEGRTGVVVYDEEQDRYSPDRLALIGELRRAIDQGELTLHYQPQVEPDTGRVGGVEALLRWQHPERGLVPPDEFIPLAERTGLIQPLTLWVLDAALRQCASWRRAGLDLWVSANLSAANLVDGDTPREIERLLRRWGVPPALFRLEITETTAMADPARTGAVLSRLDAMGVQLAIDDFGTGYSSLAYLKRLPVHELKIDRSFVSNMANDPNDEVIVTSTIDLGHNLGLRVVAEGVEDQDTLDELVRRGCDLAQGYHFTRPLPPAELRAWLTEWEASTASRGVALDHPAALAAPR